MKIDDVWRAELEYIKRVADAIEYGGGAEHRMLQNFYGQPAVFVSYLLKQVDAAQRDGACAAAESIRRVIETIPNVGQMG